MSNKIQLQENNLNLQYILEQLSSSESSLNLLTQDNTIVGELTKTSDGYKLNETKDPFGEIKDQSPLLAQLVDLVSSKYKAEGLYVWKKYEYNSASSVVGDFIEYVVSDTSSAYPDGGTQDGYWYEKKNEGIGVIEEYFGCTEIAVDTFTLAKNTYAYQSKLNHSLGKVPKLAFVYANSSDSEILDDTGYDYIKYGMTDNITRNASGKDVNFVFYLALSYYDNNKAGVGADANNVTSAQNTASSIYLYVTNYLKGGVEYTLITMA